MDWSNINCAVVCTNFFDVEIYTGQNLAFVRIESPKAELLQLKLTHLFASELLLMKKLEIEKTKPTVIISVLKVEY